MNAPIPGTLPRVRLLLALVLALGLAACGKEEPAAPAQPAATPAAPEAAAPEAAAPPTETVVVQTPEELAKRAREALDAQRLFTPPGDNAFELYLSVLDAEPDQPLAKNALTDLFPYAVMHVEQRLAANDPDDAERVLLLMEKANAAAPALPRLKADIAQARQRAAAAEAAEAERAARAEREAQEAARAAAQPAAPAPTAAPERPAPAASAPPPAATPTPTPAPAETQPAPAPAASAPPAAPRRPAGALPPVASQVSPRYPPLALRRQVEGFVEVQFTVLPDGRVTDVSVVRSEPRSMFDRAAIDAMQRWRFQPTPGGEPVRGRRLFDFKLPK